MATANPGGGGRSPGGGGAGSAGGSFQDSEVDDYCGSSSVFQPSQLLARAAAAFLAREVVEIPTQSHHWPPSLCGVDLDDEIWDIRFHFDGREYLERTMGRSDITFLNFLALVETQGYGLSDYMYCVKEEGKGVAGLEIIDCMAKVEEMLLKYEDKKIFDLTIMKGKTTPLICEEQVPISDQGDVYAIDGEGVIFKIQYSPMAKKQGHRYTNCCTEQSNNLQKDEQVVIPEEVCEDDCEEECASESSDSIEYDMGECRTEEHEEERREEMNINLCTQQSDNLQKDKEAVGPEDVFEDDFEEECDSESSDSIEYDMEEYRPEEHEEKRREEMNEVIQKMKEMKRQRDDPVLHCEGDTDVEDIFDEADQNLEEEPEPVPEPVTKQLKPIRKGPTLRSHSSVETNRGPDFVPSSDEDIIPGDLDAMDDD